MTSELDGVACTAQVQGPNQNLIVVGTVGNTVVPGAFEAVGTVGPINAFTDQDHVELVFSGNLIHDADDVVLLLLRAETPDGVTITFWEVSVSDGDITGTLPVSVAYELAPAEYCGATFVFTVGVD